MTGTFTKVKRGRRPDHARFGPTATLAQLEAAVRATYPGIAGVPAAAPWWDWRICGCDYQPPLTAGKRVRQDDDPAYADWSEQTAQGKRSLAREVRRLVVDVYRLGYFDAKDAFRLFPGWPDVTITAPGLWTTGRRIGASGGRLVRELKGMTTMTYGQQLATLTTHRLSGDDVGVWKPCCLLSGRISAELRTLASLTETPPEDVYGRQAPGGRPAVSGGPAIMPGTVPTDPMSDGEPVSARGPVRSQGGRAAGAAAALLDELAAEAVIGYRANPRDGQEAAAAVKQLVAWATGRCLAAAWPWRMVVTADRYYIRNQGGGWSEVSRLAGGTDVVALVNRLNPQQVSASSVEGCQSILSPGRRPATQGAS